MRTYLVHRLLLSLLAVFGVATIVFFVLRVIPGDPAIVFAGPSATEAQIEEIRARLGMDRSLLVQFAEYTGNLVQLDFGASYRWNRPVLQLVIERIPATALLATAALAIAVVIGIPFGLLAARQRGRWPDRVISVVSLVGQALPNFWIGIVLILLFSANLRLLPSSGIGTWKHLIMPAFTLSLPLLGVLVRLVRAGLVEVMNEDFIRSARARGVGEGKILVKHAGRNMLIPVITMIGLQFAQMLGGTVVIETVFGWPGLGRLLVDAVGTRDYAIVQAAIIAIALAYTSVNFLVDLSYGMLDPRVRVT